MRAENSVLPGGLTLCLLIAFALTLAAAALTASRTYAQQENASGDQSAATAPEKTDEGEKEDRKRAEKPVEVVFADFLRIDEVGDPERAMYLLEGNVHLRQEEVDLFADVVRMDQGRETAEATGNLRVVDPENDMVGDLLMADFAEGRITLTGNVRLVHEKQEDEEGKEESADEEAQQPPPDAPAAGDDEAKATADDEHEEPKTLRDYQKKRTILTCDRLHYYYDDKRAVCVGNVVAKQEDSTAYAHRAIYDEDVEIITLTGEVRIERKRGDIIRCEGAVINIDDDTIEAEGVRDSVVVREKKKEEAEEASGAPSSSAAEQSEAPPGPLTPDGSAPAAPESPGGESPSENKPGPRGVSPSD